MELEKIFLTSYNKNSIFGLNYIRIKKNIKSFVLQN